MANNLLTSGVLAAGIAIGTSGTIAAQQGNADKIISIKAENTKLKVANLTQVENGKWVVVVCGVMHDNNGNALPETCHQCDVTFPVSLENVKHCHTKGEGLEE